MSFPVSASIDISNPAYEGTYVEPSSPYAYIGILTNDFSVSRVYDGGYYYSAGGATQAYINTSNYYSNFYGSLRFNSTDVDAAATVVPGNKYFQGTHSHSSHTITLNGKSYYK